MIVHTSHHKVGRELAVHTAKLKAFAVMRLSTLCRAYKDCLFRGSSDAALAVLAESFWSVLSSLHD